ncbi:MULTISPECIES: CopG family ribbon-helix-helix protein [Methylobacterium]|jgi:predicted transcriptional regulator|uniref:Uncharacterized protein n=1 Tax=Methylobacterium radiotolerans (strain ATCC 27329 / DSM 1819 / JCM 2831 / NBRC 15690 / NCIMB 10815 / 0-1) TaxID=426355 RepID=B1M915_METRJ|nr:MULTISPECIES: hypothetical protein [Methylobacterium]MCY4563561.1 transcriptional regulator [Gammaproteobacteria bacterium]GAN47386.1 hypothetical protein ME121_1393 [Methylobacterium sp. ME121]ACB27990.1 conserved hypothetical protein [Methylobacterium radiotolerans JCM 2831]KTS06279.1 transcriptional regulator [Methylobacterium radiotolerans]KTS48720.1 transcriptional regulator [Methylobacterium radiotolerans]
MAEASIITPDLQARVDAIAARSGRAPAAIIADALEHGHSLDWQERYVDEVMAGRADIAAGRIASPEDVERVLNKYRPS